MNRKTRLLAGGLLMIGIAAGSSAQSVAADQNSSNIGLHSGVFDVLMQYVEEETDLLAQNETRMQMNPKEMISENEIPKTTSEYVNIAIASVQNYVNLRAEPDVDSEVLGKLYNNGAATILETVNDAAGEVWYRIESGSVTGYVKAEYVIVGDEALIRAVSTRYATVTTTTLFVRTEPGVAASILTMLPEGDDVVIYDELEDGWMRVSTEEGLGYIYGEYVTVRTEYQLAESKAEEEARLAREEAERQAAAAAAEAARREREAAERAEAQARAAAEQAKKEAQASKPSQSSQPAQTNQPSQSEQTDKKPASDSSGNSGNSNSGSVSNGQAVVNYASQFVGNPYVYGGSSLTNGADCSGFVKSVYAAFGISLPHSSSALRSVGYSVSMNDIRPGDIVCYSGHVGIYSGNNTLLHASSPSTGIKYTSPITYREVLAVRRIF